MNKRTNTSVTTSKPTPGTRPSHSKDKGSSKKSRPILQKTTLKQLLSYVKRYRFSFIFALVFAVVTVASNLIIPILTGQAIDAIIGKGKVDFIVISTILMKIAVLLGIGFISQFLIGVLNNRMTCHVVRDIRNDAFRTIQKLPMKTLDSNSPGDMTSRVIVDVEQLADGLLLGFSQLFTGVITILGTLFLLFRVNYIIALVVLFVTPISLFVSSFIAKHASRFFREQSMTRGEQTAITDEMISSMKEVHEFSMEDAVMEQFEEINTRWRKSSLLATFYSSMTNPATRFVNSLVYACVALAGGLLAIKRVLTVGDLTCILSYANQYTKPFNEISGVVTELQNAFVCASRVFALINEQRESPDVPVELEHVKGNVGINDISFSYNPEQHLIEHFFFKAEAGSRVAIVGPTGCGKTTLINLLMRFYEVDAGSITVEDKDISQVTRDSLRRSYGMVLQDTWLKNGTVYENIVMGRSKVTREDVERAAKLAHADEFIARLENGYDTVISDETAALSQGERQLLCIARVMLALPPMLILDEATSSIDTRTELLIQESFNRLMMGRTSFVVAHRLSTIKAADVILVMKDGKVIEMGDHEQLLAQKGFYNTLYNSQFAH